MDINQIISINDVSRLILSSKESPGAAATCPIVEINLDAPRTNAGRCSVECAECRRGGRKASLSHKQHFGVHELCAAPVAAQHAHVHPHQAREPMLIADTVCMSWSPL